MGKDCRNCRYGCFHNGGYDFPHVECSNMHRKEKRRLSTIFGTEGDFGVEFTEARYCEYFEPRDLGNLKQFTVDELRAELKSRGCYD